MEKKAQKEKAQTTAAPAASLMDALAQRINMRRKGISGKVRMLLFISLFSSPHSSSLFGSCNSPFSCPRASPCSPFLSRGARHVLGRADCRTRRTATTTTTRCYSYTQQLQ